MCLGAPKSRNISEPRRLGQKSLEQLRLRNLKPFLTKLDGREQIDRQTDRQAGRQTGRQTDRQTDRQTGRQTGRQADRQTDRGCSRGGRDQ